MFGYLVMLLLITEFAIPAGAVKETKVSQLNGGEQYWWEAEDFDNRDDVVFVLSGEPGSSVPELPGASDGEYIVHNTPNPAAAVEGKDFVEYKITINKGGAYYVWARTSWDRTPGGRTHNSFYVQVNGQPEVAKFARHLNTLGDANWLDDADQQNPWTWIGDSAQPAALVGQPGAGLANGLKMNFKAGENTLMLYHREGAAANNTLCTDVIMISTVDFVPTDADYGKAGLSVEPMSRLTTTWAQLKRSSGL
jgi:hypothetical protein